MDNTLLITHDARGVVRVDLNRPDVLNAFDEALIARLDQTFDTLGRDPGVRVIVLGATGKAFCAGADIAWMRRAAANTEAANLADARAFAQMMHRVASCPKPVVARVQGHAFGGGVGLVCAADIAVVAERAQFAVSETRFGILPAVIGPYVVNAVGKRQAQRLALTGERLSAAQAHAMSLVSQVCAETELDTAVEAIVSALLVNGPQALAEVKALFAQLACGEIDAAVRDLTAQTISRVRSTDEAREGFAAFVEKRPPSWICNA